MSTYINTFGNGSHCVKGILNYYRKGILTRNETYSHLKDHILWCYDNHYLTETETDACIEQIDRFYAGAINANDLETYISLVA